VVLPVVLACLGMLEIGLRVAGRPPSSNTDGIFEEYGDGAYRLQRNVSRRSTTRSFSCTLSTNAFGLRDRGPGKRDLARPYLASITSTRFWTVLESCVFPSKTS
jgi:hypothetical protein